MVLHRFVEPAMPTFSPSAYFRLARAGALYDILIITSFATPWTFAVLYPQLSMLNTSLGGAPLPDCAPVQVLFACLLGSLVLLWSALRLLRTSLVLGRFDACGRAVFALWMGWALAQGGLPLLWFFFVPEVLWAVAQAWPVAPGRSAQRPGKRTPHLTLVSRQR
jgi:hypothetical protein